jgi:hypothetical protein
LAWTTRWSTSNMAAGMGKASSVNGVFGGSDRFERMRAPQARAV